MSTNVLLTKPSENTRWKFFSHWQHNLDRFRFFENSPKSNISGKKLIIKILACAPHHYFMERNGGLFEEWWSGTQAGTHFCRIRVSSGAPTPWPPDNIRKTKVLCISRIANAPFLVMLKKHLTIFLLAVRDSRVPKLKVSEK